jgi:hypothetical protein
MERPVDLTGTGMSGDDTIEAALRKALEADQKLARRPSRAPRRPHCARVDALNAAPTTPGEPTLDELQPVATNPNDLAEMAVAAGLQGSVPQEPVLFTPTAPPSAGSPDRPSLHLRERSSSMKNRVSVICLQCGLSVDRLIHAETAQTEIDPVTYRRKCKIAPDAADFHCPELERAVERSRRWDPIVRNN